MLDLDNYIKNYVEKINFDRHKISNKKLNDLKDIKIFLTYGDLDSVVVFSNIVYPKIKDNNSYNIFISWKNLKCFVADADEYWCLSDENTIKNLYNKTDGLDNRSDGIYGLLRSLKETFYNVETSLDVAEYYKHFITDKFKKEYPLCKFKYPELTPPFYLNENLIKKIQEMNKLKVVFIPFMYNYVWENNIKMPIKKYEGVVQKLADSLSSFCELIIIQNEFTFDLSKKFQKDEVTIVREHDFSKILTIISMSHIYFDFFSNSYFLGFLAKKTMFSIYDKQSFFHFKKYEDLEIFGVSKNFTTMPSFYLFPNFEDDMLESFCRTIVTNINNAYNLKATEVSDSEIDVDLNRISVAKKNHTIKRKVLFGKVRK